ncbi:MAG: SPFH domain-containing protein, partial [Acidobacteriota bacterium]|nr:SPFH domain-containing protein [Acidobacteriota bacterium]
MRPNLYPNITAILFLLLAGASLAGCTPHHIGVTEVGVKFNKVTSSFEEYKEAGATYFFMPFLNDWRTYDTATRSLVMNRSSNSGDRKEKDDLRFKTRDGNDIETDVTIRWRIDPMKIAYIWSHVAPSSDEIEQRLVRPLARTYVRDTLNRLDSEEFYNPTLRFKAGTEATRLLGAHLEPYGVKVEQVIQGDFSFKPDYQHLINSKKESEKQAEKLEAEILATQEKNQATL